MSIQTSGGDTDVVDNSTRQLGKVNITSNYQDEYLPLILNELRRIALLINSNPLLYDPTVAVDSSGNITTPGTLTAGTYAAPFPLTSTSATLSADVVLTNNLQFYDGPTVTCVAGTWLLIACCTLTGPTNQTTKITGKLWDGTNALTSTEAALNSAASFQAGYNMTLAAIASPTATTTYKMSVSSAVNGSSTLKAANPDSGSGNNATWIVAVRIG